jgi:hypothetical protein
LRVDYQPPEAMLNFLKRCYKYVNEEWQHIVREDLPDAGFELSFRDSCITHLIGWEISQPREMYLGYGFETSSGILHEIDIVAKHPDVIAILEAKNRQGTPPDKNDVIVFFAKILDYLAFHPILLQKEICPTFMSNTSFDQNGLAACLGLGIHPIGPGLRPVPLLIDNARRINVELNKPIVVSGAVRDRFDDFCANLNSISLTLNETWITSRCGSVSDHAIVLKSTGGLDTVEISHRLRRLNADCSWLLQEVRRIIN